MADQAEAADASDDIELDFSDFTITKQVPVSEIPEEARLAEYLHTSGGRLVMSSGVKLTPRLMSLIRDLSQIGAVGKEVWIEVDA